MKQVLIADDHGVVREGLKQIVEKLPGFGPVEEVSKGADALARIREKQFDLVLLDISLGDMNGLEVLSVIKNEQPDLDVLIISFYPEDQYAVRALQAGASGYLNKESAPEELRTAIEKVSAGSKYISESVAELLLEDVSGSRSKAPHEDLSNRELQVMHEILTGKSLTEIADVLSISIKTVSTYKARILEKLSLKSVVDLMHYALKNGLVQ